MRRKSKDKKNIQSNGVDSKYKKQKWDNWLSILALQSQSRKNIEIFAQRLKK